MFSHRAVIVRWRCWSKVQNLMAQRAYGSLPMCMKTASNDPSKLTLSDVGKFYDVPVEEAENLSPLANFSPHYYQQYKLFGELSWMCRRPLLESIHVLRMVENSATVPFRLVLWGKYGTGKTVTLLQLCHYCALRKWVVFYVKSVMNWTRHPKEIQMSNFKQGRVDTPFEAQDLLKTFKMLNTQMWPRLSELTTEKTYEWSKLEKTAEGRPITEIVDVGLKAHELASDCVGALLQELKRHATQDKIKCLVAIDDSNSLFFDSKIKQTGGKYVPAKDITLSEQMKKMVSPDWKNGACLLIADKKEHTKARDIYTVPINTPLECFGEQGFEAIEPFIPIETSIYSREEIANAYAYYRDLNWIATDGGKSDVGKKELMFLSGFNPFRFERLCSFL